MRVSIIIFGVCGLMAIATGAVLQGMSIRLNPLLLCGAGVVVVALALTAWRTMQRQFGGEPERVAQILDDFAKGDFSVDIPSGSIGILGGLGRVRATMKEVVRQGKAIALGDYRADTAPVSERDELGATLQEMTRTLREVAGAAGKIAEGDMKVRLAEKGENDLLAKSMNRLCETILSSIGEKERQAWLSSGRAELAEIMRGNLSVERLAAGILDIMVQRTNSSFGAMYVVTAPGDRMTLMGFHAYCALKRPGSTLSLGEGIAGQAALDRHVLVVNDLPPNYIRIASTLGETTPVSVLAIPLVQEGSLMGVVELASLTQYKVVHIEFAETMAESAALGLQAAQSRARLQEMLEETQRQAEELQTQQEELRTSNEELSEMTRTLRESEEELKSQQEELQTANEELSERNKRLETQRREISTRNAEIESARSDLERKAAELEAANKYKSEFLANMSHELRTPLNSILILARNLADNRKRHLDEGEVESAGVIHKSGTDLLSLISEILDLSRIEAGRMRIELGEVPVDSLANGIRSLFAEICAEKKLEFVVGIAEDVRSSMVVTDRTRIEQIIKNLLANAVKFTDAGRIAVHFHRPSSKARYGSESLARLGSETILAVSVSDTGIGIPPDKFASIFEAFQQLDTGASRKYQGAGLGLSISRELAKLLGGEIQLESEVGKGSMFTLLLPVVPTEVVASAQIAPAPHALKPKAETDRKAIIPSVREEGIKASAPSRISDDLGRIQPGDKVILVVEDDTSFAKVLLDACHEKGFKAVHAPSGEDALEFVKGFVPDGVILDVRLPKMSGWSVLDALKDTPETLHVPVHVLSVEKPDFDATRKGAIGFMEKPINADEMATVLERLSEVIGKATKDLLVVEDDPVGRKSVMDLIGNGNVRSVGASTAAEALEMIGRQSFDCVILDLKLPDMSGFDLLNKLKSSLSLRIPPVIVYTGRDLTREEELRLREYADSIIVKGVKSQERLLNETALFMHRSMRHLPAVKREMVASLHDPDRLFKGRRILVVDDDMRNLFALSRILEERGAETIKAENGVEAIAVLERNESVDLVILDMMMPMMDGYETAARIRKMERRSTIPVIALTAKAMSGDRGKCIAAGASDYLPKPVDQDRLFSLLRVWLGR